jgi:glycosyltransferase involved in cell wall biosynthesis
MKLVLAGRLAWKNDEFMQKLKTYKYRDDIILTDYIPEEELARLTAAAYALVYPSLFEGFGVPVLEAMKCEVPAISSANTSMQEVAGDAGLYFDANDHADIADKLMLIYKDEGLRNRMIEQGKEVAALYSWDHSAEMLWQAIVKAMNIEQGTRNVE